MANASSSTGRDCLLILGMHRSGTSALSGSFAQLGFQMPVGLAPADHNNKRGYFEAKPLWDVSDQLFEAIGSGWDDWAPIDVTALPEGLYETTLAQAVEGIAAQFPDPEGPFVLKDPRMCRLLPLWLAALSQAGCRVHPVLTHRDPREVAASLARRDGMAPGFALLMWMRYVLEAERWTRGMPRAFTSYRLLLDDWRAVMKRIDALLDIDMAERPSQNGDKVDALLSRTLRNFSDAPDATLNDPSMPENLCATFSILERWSETGEDTADFRTLDRLRDTLDQQALLFGPLLRPGQKALAALDDTQAELKTARDSLAARKEALLREVATAQNLREDLAQRDADLDRLSRDIARRDESLQALAKTADRLRERVVAQDRDLHTKDGKLRTTEGRLSEARAEATRLRQVAAQAKGDHTAILGSTSWRITAPLRRLKRFMFRGKKGA